MSTTTTKRTTCEGCIRNGKHTDPVRKLSRQERAETYRLCKADDERERKV